MKQTVAFTYDAIYLTRLVMGAYADELEGKHTKAVQFARYEYLQDMTDEELKEHLDRYMREENIEAITFKDWRKDCVFLFRYIYETDRYKTLELKFNKSGFGETGLGVVDKSDNTFYHCGLAEHWSTIMGIIQAKSPELHRAFEAMTTCDKLDEYKGVTRNELDAILTSRFELVGEQRPIQNYL